MAAEDRERISAESRAPGCVFADKGPAVVAQEPEALLAWLNSTRSRPHGCEPAGGRRDGSRGPRRSRTRSGWFQKLPWPGPVVDKATLDAVVQHSVDIAERRRREDALDETARLFVAPPLPTSAVPRRHRIRPADNLVLRGDLVGRRFRSGRALFSETLALDADAIAYLDEEIGPHPDSYPHGPLDDEAAFTRWFELPMDQLIDEVIATRGASRAVATMTFVADRRLEVLAHGFERHPSVVFEARDRLALLPPGEPKQTADDLVSYLIGIAFGRWDVRIGQEPSRHPRHRSFSSLCRLCPPGMLVGSDGFPAVDAVHGYPLELPSTGLLIDEPGHRWDVEAAVLRAVPRHSPRIVTTGSPRC